MKVAELINLLERHSEDLEVRIQHYAWIGNDYAAETTDDVVGIYPDSEAVILYFD